MLRRITDLNDPRIHILKDDPVRPNIPADQRVTDRGTIYLWCDEDKEDSILAAVCVMLCDSIPESEETLLHTPVGDLTVAVAYTIWSYSAGAARKLINAVRESVPKEVTTVVTLSPQTEMARKFHTGNGAELVKENPTTWNFLYPSKGEAPAQKFDTAKQTAQEISCP
jgi:hypothetical protein